MSDRSSPPVSADSGEEEDENGDEDGAAEVNEERPDVPFAYPPRTRGGQSPKRGKVPGGVAKGGLRLRGTKFFLTYAGIAEGETNKEAILAKLKAVTATHGGLSEWIVAQEDHTNPTVAERNIHFHVYFMVAGNGLDSLNPQLFDVIGTKNGQSRPLHPWIQVMRTKEEDRLRVIAYVRKDGFYTCKIIGGVSDSAGGKGGSGSYGEDMMACDSKEEAIDMLRDNYPDLFMRSYASFMPALDKHFGRNDAGKYKPEDFNEELLDLTVAVVLSGESNCGKTQFSLAHGEYPLQIRQWDDLKLISSKTDVLVFDDMNFNKIKLEDPAGDIIHLLDMECGSSMKCRHQNAYIPKGMPRIFTTNAGMTSRFDHIFPDGANAAQHSAITRRYRVVKVSKPLFNAPVGGAGGAGGGALNV